MIQKLDYFIKEKQLSAILKSLNLPLVSMEVIRKAFNSGSDSLED
jgi:hypothetical protein